VNKTLIVIPTYNEKDNIVRLIEAIHGEKVLADILVVDDNSPDGTGKIVEKLSKKDSSTHVMHRQEKVGLGKAYVAGFKRGVDAGYEKLISMDADFSHPYTALKTMISLSKPDRVVIGSRYVKGGRITGWRWPRYINSWGANWITRTILRIKAKDVTAGFKSYPVEFFKKIDLDKVQASGYAFMVEMSLLAQENGFKLVETPITFADREVGESKIQGELIKSAKLVFHLAAQKKSYRQFVKFCIVGTINTGVDWAVFYPAKIVLSGLQPQTAKQIAKAISFVISALSNYIMNRKWTFRSKEKQIVKEGAKFMLVAFGGLAINQAVFYLATGQLHWRDIFGLIAATAAATLWNFFINKQWTFKNK